MTTRRTLRLVVRQHRFGFAMVLVSAGVFAICAVFIAWLAFGPLHACLQAGLQPPALTDAEMRVLQTRCEFTEWAAAIGSDYVQTVSLVLPFSVAILLTVPLIAAELELGTATLAWSLARTRRSWLAPRMALIVLIALGVGVVAGLASDALVAQTETRSPWASLYHYEIRGAMTAARTLVIASSGMLAGALLGRQLPALVLGAALAAGVVFGVATEDQQINQANEVVLVGDPTGNWTQDDLHLDSRVQDISSGQLLTWDQFPNGVDPSDASFQAKYRMVDLGIPASQAPLVVWRNVAFYAMPSFLLLGLTFVVVERRRPYLS